MSYLPYLNGTIKLITYTGEQKKTGHLKKL